MRVEARGTFPARPPENDVAWQRSRSKWLTTLIGPWWSLSRDKDARQKQYAVPAM